MPDATPALREALVTALVGGSIGGSPSIPIFSNVPQSLVAIVEPPYITVSLDSTDDGTKTATGQSFAAQIDAWTWDDGPEGGEGYLAEVYELLHENEDALTVTGHDVVLIRFEFSQSFIDADGRTWHSTHRYRIHTEAQ